MLCNTLRLYQAEFTHFLMITTCLVVWFCLDVDLGHSPSNFYSCWIKCWGGHSPIFVLSHAVSLSMKTIYLFLNQTFTSIWLQESPKSHLCTLSTQFQRSQSCQDLTSSVVIGLHNGQSEFVVPFTAEKQNEETWIKSQQSTQDFLKVALGKLQCDEITVLPHPFILRLARSLCWKGRGSKQVPLKIFEEPCNDFGDSVTFDRS